MGLVTANDVTVIEGSITRPQNGVWTANLKLDDVDGSGFDPGTSVTIESEGGYSIKGVVDPSRAGAFLDAMHVRVLGGAGGMGTIATARSFGQGTFVRDVLNGLMQDSGETLSSTADAGLLSTQINGWSVMARTVGWNLRALLRILAPAMVWRMLPDGTLWIGSETWPAASGTSDTLTQDPADGSYVLGVEAPFVSPGTSIDGLGNINRCVDVITGGKLRTHVYVDLPSEGSRGLTASIGRMVAQANAGIDYYASYKCQVVAQSADLTTVDITPIGARNKQLLGGLQRVEVRGVGGIKVQFAPGATVMLEWDGGDPSQPFVSSGSSSETPTQIQIGGTHPMVLWDTFRTRLATELGKILGANSGGNILSDGGVTMATFLTALSGGTYDSQKATNG